MSRDMFPDYQPKRTPDTIHDYIGKWASRSGKKPADVLGKIPEATLDNLPAIVDLFVKYKKATAKDPGTMAPGNMILGADKEEYIPSESELVASELGMAIKTIINKFKPAEIAVRINASKAKMKEISFVPVTFTHVDVMGSGRFVYAHKGGAVTVRL
jgi:hypothetical protein